MRAACVCLRVTCACVRVSHDCVRTAQGAGLHLHCTAQQRAPLNETGAATLGQALACGAAQRMSCTAATGHTTMLAQARQPQRGTARNTASRISLSLSNTQPQGGIIAARDVGPQYGHACDARSAATPPWAALPPAHQPTRHALLRGALAVAPLRALLLLLLARGLAHGGQVVLREQLVQGARHAARPAARAGNASEDKAGQKVPAWPGVGSRSALGTRRREDAAVVSAALCRWLLLARAPLTHAWQRA
jgi:hypothetical protein